MITVLSSKTSQQKKNFEGNMKMLSFLLSREKQWLWNLKTFKM